MADLKFAVETMHPTVEFHWAGGTDPASLANYANIQDWDRNGTGIPKPSEQTLTDYYNNTAGPILAGYQAAEVEKATDKAAIQQAQADAAIAAIGAELTQANADLAGWDAMTTADKMAATKRMLARQIEIEQRQRKIIKYVRWL